VWFGAPSSTQEDARANLEKHMAHQATHGFGLWAVELRETDEVIGVTGLGHLADGPEIEVGYRFLREHWGNGYATEAARASIEFGLDELGLEQLAAVTLPTNNASRRVMERCGMVFVGVMDVYGREHVKYTIAR
jgi:RimJ/RimL family protein N-acetyltransferase